MNVLSNFVSHITYRINWEFSAMRSVRFYGFIQNGKFPHMDFSLSLLFGESILFVPRENPFEFKFIRCQIVCSIFFIFFITVGLW